MFNIHFRKFARLLCPSIQWQRTPNCGPRSPPPRVRRPAARARRTSESLQTGSQLSWDRGVGIQTLFSFWGGGARRLGEAHRTERQTRIYRRLGEASERERGRPGALLGPCQSRARARARQHTGLHARARARTQARRHAGTHARTHARTHAHTLSRSPSLSHTHGLAWRQTSCSHTAQRIRPCASSRRV